MIAPPSTIGGGELPRPVDCCIGVRQGGQSRFALAVSSFGRACISAVRARFFQRCAGAFFQRCAGAFLSAFPMFAFSDVLVF
jgi:hypothetical protein